MTEPNDGPKLADFKVHFGDAGESDAERQPLRVCIAARWGARRELSTQSEPSERVMAVSADNFEHVFERFGPRFALELTDPVDGGAPRIKAFVRWSKLSALRPSEMVEAVPELSAFVEAHRVLERAKAGATAELRTSLERVLPRAHWVDAVLAPLEGPLADDGAAQAEVAADVQKPDARAPSKQPSGDDLGSLFDLVDTGAAPQPAPEGNPAASLVNRLAGITPARRGPASSGLEAAREGVRQLFARLLIELLEHPEVARLEGLWRGLKVLLGSSSRCKEVQLFVAWLAEDEDEALEAILAQDFDLLCLDREVDASASQLDWLERAGSAAAHHQTPLLVNASPGLLGLEGFGDLNSRKQTLLFADHPALDALRLRAARPATRWVTLAGNGLRIRAPHDAQSSRLKEMKFEQPPTDGAHVLMPASFGLAALVIRSVAREGHPYAFVGADRGTLSELETHHLERADVAIATQDLVGTDAQDDAAEVGVALFAPVKNRAIATLSSAPLLFRGEEAAKGQRSRPRHLLSEALLLSRLARVLRETKRRFRDLPDDGYTRKLRGALLDLFPGAAPPGPVVEVHLGDGTLKVRVDPRRYGTLQVPELTLEIDR